ncbi:MAG TPA: GtrA family protein [Trebonia sp.]|nr:GtrA family protein [Trebonia sp.]
MSSEARGQWFASAMAAVARRLPFGLSEVVPPNVLGYLVINLCTFCIDLGLLTVFHGVLGVIPPVAVTLSYSIASLTSYGVNRVLNFRSHGSLSTQLPLSIAIFVVNYLVFLLGVFEGLLALGLEYQLARILAACCEGVFLYCCMRFLVFKDASGNKPVGPQHAAQPATAAPASETQQEESRPAVPARREGE